MRQRILFGNSVSLGQVAARGAVGGEFGVTLPTFGTNCVCCSAATELRQSYDASTDRIQAPPIEMPVCRECKDHAFAEPMGAVFRGIGFVIAVGSIAYGAYDGVAGLAIAGIAVLVAVIASARVVASRQARAATGGHHPGLEMSLRIGTLLDTNNETLVEDLLARNANAKRLPTPPLWKLRGEGMPKAKVVRTKPPSR